MSLDLPSVQAQKGNSRVTDTVMMFLHTSRNYETWRDVTLSLYLSLTHMCTHTHIDTHTMRKTPHLNSQ